MAVVRNFEIKELGHVGQHTEVEATVSLVEFGGEKFVQIDTYGSKSRSLPGKTSQSLRLTKDAFAQLASLAAKHY